MGGNLLLKLNIDSRPIANKYREGKVKRTLERELKVSEIAGREANETSLLRRDCCRRCGRACCGTVRVAVGLEAVFCVCLSSWIANVSWVFGQIHRFFLVLLRRLKRGWMVALFRLRTAGGELTLHNLGDSWCYF